MLADVSRPIVDFGREISAAFGIRQLLNIDWMPGGANVLWRMETGDDTFVVKELPAEHVDAYRAAADFEQAVWDAGAVTMAQPCQTASGALLHPTEGTRGHPVVVRVHPLVRGHAIPVPIAPEILAQAGEVLGRLHQYGAQSPDRLPAKEFWSKPDEELYERFRAASPGEDINWGAAWRALCRTAELASHRPHHNQIPAHCDFKPANCLLDAGVLVVLDWDEAGGSDPRLDSVASALCWSRPTSPTPSVEAFAIFAAAYRRVVGSFPPVEPMDFVTSLFGQTSWYEFMARTGRTADAVEALHGLIHMWARLPDWCASINARLSKE